MWREDDWFQGLPTDARLLFIYLFTNPSASIAGIYRLPLRTIEFESGIPAERINELLAQFSAMNKAHYDNGVVWVVKMRENQLPGASISPKVKIRLDKDVASIPDCPLKTRYLKHYGYPIDTLSIPVPTETDTETDTETKLTKQDAAAAVFACWKDNMPGTMSSILADDLGDLIDTYGADTVIRAITEAVRSNGRSIRYVAKILENWATGKGKRSAEPAPSPAPVPVVMAGFSFSETIGG
jgi:DnaD/phage-associated family protein